MFGLTPRSSSSRIRTTSPSRAARMSGLARMLCTAIHSMMPKYRAPTEIATQSRT